MRWSWKSPIFRQPIHPEKERTKSSGCWLSANHEQRPGESCAYTWQTPRSGSRNPKENRKHFCARAKRLTGRPARFGQIAGPEPILTCRASDSVLWRFFEDGVAKVAGEPMLHVRPLRLAFHPGARYMIAGPGALFEAAKRERR